MKLSILVNAFALILMFGAAGCGVVNHVDKTAYANEMARLSDKLKYKGQPTVLWPYRQNQNALLFKIGNGGNGDVNPSFYEKLDRMEALTVRSVFTAARRKAGFSFLTASKCSVYICDDNGIILCHADEKGVHKN